ncbi:MAG: glycosyltransferase [Acidimicrobiales bacterium]|nr:glycosyltransferase [Acidimicrobiales bacterium]MCB9392664.1 glycosyltransferase [Acidimicrobiaceae bacterium]
MTRRTARLARHLLPAPTPWSVARGVATTIAIARLARAARRRPPLGRDDAATAAGLLEVVGGGTELPSISVVVPARDEAPRIGPLLAAVVGAPGVSEVLVVDDESTDGTAELATTAGAVVVPGTQLPHGWAGKAWAVHQGVRAARGDWVVTLDADTRPDPELPRTLVNRALADGLQFVSVGGRFECPTAGAAWLHPALLTTLVYRFGPPGSTARTAPHRQLANGQCTAFPRVPFLRAGGLQPVAGEVVEDVALARHLAARGWRVTMLDGAELLATEMYPDGPSTWRGWARSLALPGVEPRWRQVLDLVVVAIAQASPLPRLLLRRGDVVDLVLVAVRAGTLAGTRRAYRGGGAAYWLSPLADTAAVAALVRGIVSPRQPWRGRSYATRTRT